MSTLLNRVRKLEAAQPEACPPTVAVIVCGMDRDGHGEPAFALLLGGAGGQLRREEGEAAEAFRERVAAWVPIQIPHNGRDPLPAGSAA